MVLWRARWQYSFISLIVFCCFIPAYNSGAAGPDISKGPITLEADSVAYDKEKDTYHAKGNVLIVFSGGLLMAESVVLNKATNEAVAEDYVMLISDGDILEGDKVEFNIESKTGVAYQGKMFFVANHFYIKGTRIEKTGEASYHFENATATACDGDAPDWRLTGRELDVTIDGYGTLKNGKFLASNVPVLYSPYLLFPAKTSRQSGLLSPYIGYSADKLGWDIEIPFYWAISEDTDATFYQRYMDKRGFKEGVEFRYNISKDTFGTFYGDFMNDTARITETGETNGGIPRDWQSDHKRWSYFLNQVTTFDPSFYLRTDIQKVSDSFYFKDFSSHNYYLDNYASTPADRFKQIPFYGDQSLGSLDSTVRLVKDWQLYSLTALVSYTDDFASASNDATLQKYPEITLKRIKSPLFGSPLNFEFDAAYDYYYSNEGQKGHLFDLQPALSLPVRWHDFLQITPQIGVKSTSWSRDDNVDTGQSKQGSRELYTIGASATTEVQRIFDVGGENIDKIRHGIRPELTYTYIPSASQTDIPNFVAAIPEQNTLTYSLTNTILAKLNEKDGGKSYREILRFKLAQTYDFTDATRPFSEVDMELDVKPLQYLSFMARNKYSVNSGEWLQANYDMNISDWRGDSATVGYRSAKTVVNVVSPDTATTPFTTFLYSQAAGEELDISLKAVITNSVDLIYVQRTDTLDSIILERTYGVKYHKQCWSVEVYSTETQNDKTYMVGFSLLGLGKFGGR
ncbi:MAG: LPS assembly protein LptD [Syntrophales bacterium]|jgi:LPS-assembly protein